MKNNNASVRKERNPLSEHIFMMFIRIGEGTSENNNHIMYVTSSKPNLSTRRKNFFFAVNSFFMAQLSEINIFDPLFIHMEEGKYFFLQKANFEVENQF